jgi:hypothetical protein
MQIQPALPKPSYTVGANGESSAQQHYFFEHNSPLTGENLYRLRMVDKDTTLSFSRYKLMCGLPSLI